MTALTPAAELELLLSELCDESTTDILSPCGAPYPGSAVHKEQEQKDQETISEDTEDDAKTRPEDLTTRSLDLAEDEDRRIIADATTKTRGDDSSGDVVRLTVEFYGGGRHFLHSTGPFKVCARG